MSETKKTPSKPGGFESYRKTDVLTANRETILLMMYAGAMRFIRQAKEAPEVLERTRLVGKAQEIISELRSTLNFEAGKEIATQLDALYGFILMRLSQGCIERKDAPLDEALTILGTLNEAWEQAVSAVRKEKTGP